MGLEAGSVLFGKTRGAVLALLMGRPDEEFHVRQIARLTGSGLGPVQRELLVLTRIGVLARRTAGRQVFYRADDQSPLYNELRGLTLKTVGAAALLANAIQPLSDRILFAFIFGSLAANRQRQSSDIDLMIIGDVEFSTLAHAIAEPQRMLNREVNPSVYRLNEFARKLSAGHAFLTAVLDAPKIFLIGDEHELRRLGEERLAAPASSSRARNRGAQGGHRARSGRQRR
jgi:predicted nucleotidyltransferase